MEQMQGFIHKQISAEALHSDSVPVPVACLVGCAACIRHGSNLLLFLKIKHMADSHVTSNNLSTDLSNTARHQDIMDDSHFWLFFDHCKARKEVSRREVSLIQLPQQSLQIQCGACQLWVLQSCSAALLMDQRPARWANCASGARSRAGYGSV
eukprot:scaffold223013_cov18-Tisochrysis_lutea.AAC.1